jgi:hypothetical protein
MMTCPDCKGTKKVYGIGCGSGGCKPMAFDCFRCKGLGVVPDEMIDWIKKGKALKEARMNPYVNQREKAKRLGVSVAIYSQVELGYINPEVLTEATQ